MPQIDLNTLAPFIGAEITALESSFETAEYLHRQGRLTDEAWRRYRFFWTWSAPRDGGAAGRAHDRAFHRLGSAAYWRRIERGAAMARRYLESLSLRYATATTGAPLAPRASDTLAANRAAYLAA